MLWLEDIKLLIFPRYLAIVSSTYIDENTFNSMAVESF